MGNKWNMSNHDGKGNKDSTTVTVVPVRTESAKSLVEAAYQKSLQKRKTGCQELVQSSAILPSIHLHCSTCTCPPPSPRDPISEDEALSRRIRAASAVCRAKALSSPTSSPKLTSFSSFTSVTRWLTGSSTSPTSTTTSVTELCHAVSALDIAKVTTLLFDSPSPPNLNARDTAGLPPLISCIRSPLAHSHPLSQNTMLTLLLDAGADPNVVTSSPSPSSSSSSSPTSHPSHPISALSSAAHQGHTPLILTLLSRGAAVDAPLTTLPLPQGLTGNGLTSLHVAISATQRGAAVALLSAGADLSITFDAYHRPTQPKSPTSAKVKGSGRRYSRVWTRGISALHLASLSGSGECTDLLLRHEADKDARDSLGRTALHWAAVSGGEGSVRVVRRLLEAGTAVDGVDDDGATPLALAVGRVEEVEVGNGRGRGREGYWEVVKVLIEAGANVGLRYPGEVSLGERMGAL